MQLEGRTAVVTGAGRGIGEGIARCFARAGASVAIVDVDTDAAGGVAESLREAGTASIAVTANAADEREMAAAFERISSELDTPGILVNNAGATAQTPDLADYAPVPPITNMTQENWDEQIANNLRSTFVSSKSAVPYLTEAGGGAIVNIASIAGLMPSPTLPAYGAAKAGVIHLTKTLALELAAADIRVNAICPGFLWTRAWEMLAEVTKEQMKETYPALAEMSGRDVFLFFVSQQVPLGREQTPEDIGQLAVFLASDAAHNITGQEIKVDGGITLGATRT